jgi:biopolymer transport protein ExbB/TolQ
MASPLRSKSGASSTLAAFIVGLPAGIGLVWLLTVGPLRSDQSERYLHHPVEKVELIMFCAAMAALGAKWLGSLFQKAGLRAEILPAWDGKAVPVSHAAQLLRDNEEALHSWRRTWIARRYYDILEFVKLRGSASGLDDQLRTLADVDAMNLDSSYSLTRFITWAIPILGFLGTVLGITEAISNVDDKMERVQDLTGGLGLAFDATALGLGLTMVLMFVNFLVERTEHAILGQVDTKTEVELGHRFVRTDADHAPIVAAVEASSQHLFDTAEGLVRRQSELWAQSLEKIASAGRESAKDQHKLLIASLESAISAALAKNAERVAAMEAQMLARQEKLLTTIAGLAENVTAASQKNHQGLIAVTEKIAQQTAALAQIQQSGGELTKLQQSLAKNLEALAGAGMFDEAVHSLTAAVHMLTARVNPAPKKAA